MARDYTTRDQNIRNTLNSYNRPSYGGNVSYAQNRNNQSNGSSVWNDAYNVYDTIDTVNDVWNAGSAAGLGGGNAAAPALNMGWGGAGTGNLGLGGAGSSLSSAAGLAAMAAILGMGAFGMPSGKANIERLKRERRDKIIKEKINPFTGMMEGMSGMSNADLIASQRPPQTPWEAEQAYIRGNELGSYRGQGTGGGGDQDYEVDSARQQWEMNPERDRINSEFLAQGDNSKWYNPDMSRTDYMGEVYANSPGLTKLADASRNFFIPGTTIPLGNDNPTQAAVEQYNDYLAAGGEPGNFSPNFQNSTTDTQPDASASQPGLFSGEKQIGNIYGNGATRQTYNGKDLYADQTLYNSKKYKGYA